MAITNHIDHMVSAKLNEIEKLIKGVPYAEAERIIAMVYGWAIKQSADRSSRGTSASAENDEHWHTTSQQWDR